MSPQVSIIMPCLNSAQHVRESVASALAQTRGDFELLVVDNGSTDATLEIVAGMSDPRIRVLHQPERGVSRARNLGLRESRGALVAFLDSDDTWSPDFLEKMCAALAARPDAPLAYCGWQNVGLAGPRGAPFVPPDYESPEKPAALLEGCRWPIHGCLTRAEAIRAAGGFDTRLAVGEDYLLWLEVASQGPIVRVAEVLAQYRHHDGVQATKNLVRAALDTLRAKQIFLGHHPEARRDLGKDKIRALTWGRLIQTGNEFYWRGNIEAARPLFRKALLAGQGTWSDRARMLPSLFPLALHQRISGTGRPRTGRTAD
jgi:GT2 family glycosyltransferase